MEIDEFNSYSPTVGEKNIWIDVGPFFTEIGHWKENQYYQLSLETEPRCDEIDTDKNFKTVESVKKYYLTQLKKVLKEALEALE